MEHGSTHTNDWCIFNCQDNMPVILLYDPPSQQWIDLDSKCITAKPFHCHRLTNGIKDWFWGVVYIGTFIDLSDDVKQRLDRLYYDGASADLLLRTALNGSIHNITLSQITF